MVENRGDRLSGHCVRFNAYCFAALAAIAVMACAPFLIRSSFSWVEMNPWLQLFVFALAASAFYHACADAGSANAVRLLLISFSVSYGCEIIGVNTGWLFGARYAYHPAVVPNLPGAVPLVIPLMWFGLANAARVFLRSVTVRAGNSISYRRVLTKAALSAIFCVAVDLSLDPLGVACGLWTWEKPGAYFGTPYHNFIGWFLVSFAVCAGYLFFETPRPPTGLREHAALEASFALVTLLLLGILLAACWIHLPDGLPTALTLLAVGFFGGYWMTSSRLAGNWAQSRTGEAE